MEQRRRETRNGGTKTKRVTGKTERNKKERNKGKDVDKK